MFSITQTNITIMVSDMSNSIAFYKNVLGFALLKQYGNFYAQLSAPGVVIGLHPAAQKALPSENISIGFTVDGFNEVKKQLDTLAVLYTVRNEEGGKFIHFSDPDGTPLYFVEPKW